MVITGLDEQIRALRERRAFVVPDARTIAVRGADAAGWLNDLVTAGVDRLGDGESVRSLILSPTGRIRADLHVLRSSDRFLLVQSLDQPEPVDAILLPYVLSSAVELEPVETEPVLHPAPASEGAGWRCALEPVPGAAEVGRDAAEAWRIAEGIVAFPIDLDAGSLPSEAGLDVPPVTDTGKGCFLGQESVARVRNLGHPTKIVVRLRADRPVVAGEDVLARGEPAGLVTSTAPEPGGPGFAVLARIRWDADTSALRTAAGTPLEPS